MGKLLAISLVISLLGIFALLFLALSQTPVKLSGNTVLNSYVKAEGQVTSVKTYTDFNIIQLDTNITAVCFKCNLKIGQKILVTGTLEEYQGERQINVETIKVLS